MENNSNVEVGAINTEGGNNPNIEMETVDTGGEMNGAPEGAEQMVTPASNDEGKKKKRTKCVGILAGIVVVLALGCGGMYYYMTQNQNEPEKREEIATVEPKVAEISEFRMAGNELSDFDLEFMKLGEAGGNKIYSPLSIKYALAMLKDAAKGETKEQIEDVIGDYKPKAYINSENLALANAMFVNTEFQDKIQESYMAGIQKNYNAEVIPDSFATPKTANDWVKKKTLGIIDEMFDESQVNPELNYMLVNALAIDMKWNYELQCADQGPTSERVVDCHEYASKPYRHEDYLNSINQGISEFEKMQFSSGKEVESAHIGANANSYDIIAEVGEEKIRETVLKAYEEWAASEEGQRAASNGDDGFKIETYMEELKANYGKVNSSTDFKVAVNETEKVFVKELKEYDGTTLEYIGIMPTEEDLSKYVKNLDAEKAKEVIETAKEISKENFKDGVVTKISGYIPFFKFDQQIELTDYLPKLGITDVFSGEEADLSAMIIGATEGEGEREHIGLAIHKADIDFSNDGIKAAAVTAFGGLGGGGPQFTYDWEVPVEEIDMTFDKPFLFLIRDKGTGEVWFAGEVIEI